jgi:hypothetical protein
MHSYFSKSKRATLALRSLCRHEEQGSSGLFVVADYRSK